MSGTHQPQAYEIKAQNLRTSLRDLTAEAGGRALSDRIRLAWSNWGFGLEPLAVSAARLQRHGVRYMEVHGNHYGKDLGYRATDVLKMLADHGVEASGVCGMFSAEADLSSTSGTARQRAVDYLCRELEFAAEIKAAYVLVVPGAVGRPKAYDPYEFDRSVATLRLVADKSKDTGVRMAVEPIRSAEVSFCHTVSDAIRYIEAVDHPAVQHINGDVFHMQAEEDDIGEAIVQAGGRLANLHLADSNRRALGLGSMDLDSVIRACYIAGLNRRGFATAEPLGPGGDPYPAMHGRPDPDVLDQMVGQTARYWREREDVVRECAANDLHFRVIDV